MSIPNLFRAMATAIAVASALLLGGCAAEAPTEGEESSSEVVKVETAGEPGIDPTVMQWTCVKTEARGWECWCTANCKF
jgi:hypothetical protein